MISPDRARCEAPKSGTMSPRHPDQPPKASLPGPVPSTGPNPNGTVKVQKRETKPAVTTREKLCATCGRTFRLAPEEKFFNCPYCYKKTLPVKKTARKAPAKSPAKAPAKAGAAPAVTKAAAKKVPAKKVPAKKAAVTTVGVPKVATAAKATAPANR